MEMIAYLSMRAQLCGLGAMGEYRGPSDATSTYPRGWVFHLFGLAPV